MSEKSETMHSCGFTMMVLFALTATVAVRPATAQGGDAAAAQAVGAAFLKAEEAADWKAAAGFLDLEPLERERQMAATMARQQREAPPLTVERLMQMDPEMPRAAAEYQVKRMNRREKFPNFLEMQFGVGDADSLLALPIEVVAQRWLEVRDERWSYRLALRMSNCAKSVTDTTGMPVPNYRVIGTVVDDTLAYMLYSSGGINSRRPDLMHSLLPEIVRLVRTRGTWWVLPTAQTSGGLAAMKVECLTVPPKKPS
jgi:hypothetical protein